MSTFNIIPLPSDVLLEIKNKREDIKLNRRPCCGPRRGPSARSSGAARETSPPRKRPKYTSHYVIRSNTKNDVSLLYICICYFQFPFQKILKPFLENSERDEGDVVPARDHRREQRADGGEAEAGAVHHLDAEVLRQPTADDLRGWKVVSHWEFLHWMDGSTAFLPGMHLLWQMLYHNPV